MVALQFAIGAVNDLVDAPRDAVVKPGKPIPAGAVSPAAARLVAAVGLATGLLLSASFGPLLLGVAVAGLATGLVYDLRLKGTAWSWLPFALGIPLLPVYAWLGATGALPGAFAISVPAAVLAGAGLSVANAASDLERDRASGADSLAVRLGRRRTWALVAILQAAAVAVALVSMTVLGGPGAGSAVALAGAATVGLGVVAGASGVATRLGRAELAWEVQGVGLAILAAGWASVVLVPSYP
jgi:4-hydroxybenzoate polyprenyltransferase